jgi:predicted RNA-binding protein with PIN domain
MSKRTYIIDGYNAIHRIPEWAALLDAELARGRAALCSYCAEWMSSRKDAERFIVVFDGDSSVSPFGSEAYRGVQIIYTMTNVTADSKIISLVDYMVNPADATVVSDDREVMRSCRTAGAEISSVRSFVGTLRHTDDTGKNRTGETGPKDNLSPAQRNQITNDLKREWGVD